MDKSKMAKPGTKIKYDPFKESYCNEGMSRPVKQRCGSYCEGSGGCKCDKSLEDTLNPPKDDDICGPCCC